MKLFQQNFEYYFINFEITVVTFESTMMQQVIIAKLSLSIASNCIFHNVGLRFPVVVITCATFDRNRNET